MADALMWPDEIYRILRDWDVTQFSYVPDAGHAVLINRSLEDPEVHSVALTTEEEGVAMLAGAHLGGARGVALMQSSGVGNCVNMFSFVKKWPVSHAHPRQHAWGFRRRQPLADADGADHTTNSRDVWLHLHAR